MKLQRIKTIKDVETGLAKLLKLDPRLKAVAKQADPLPLRLQEPGFAGLARIIIGQQVSRASAEAITSRFVEQVVPTSPQAYLDAGEPVWIAIGLSRAKQRALTGLSHAILENTLPIDNLATMHAHEAMEKLTAIKGIGPWTAEVYLLFCAGHADIFPAGDLALQEGIRHAYGMQDRPTEKEVREMAESWKPLRGIAARLFWSYYKVIKDGRDALPL